MMDQETARHTFNPWTGCAKVSPGCDHCYAEGWAKRSGHVKWGPKAERRRTSPATWRAPLKWNREAEVAGERRRVFCASLSDVFDNQVPIEWHDDLWDLINETPHLDWLLLTKRPQNIAGMLPDYFGPELWPHVWLGTTVETQAEAERRIPALLSVPAARHFLSCEPLLGPVDLTALCVDGDYELNVLAPISGQEAWDRHWSPAATGLSLSAAIADFVDEGYEFPPRQEKTNGIDWVICGGEGGPGARPMHPDWARSLRDQCTAYGVPFFFKQWGEWSPVTLEDDNDDHVVAYAMEGCGARAEAHCATQACLFWQGRTAVAWPDVATLPAVGARRTGKKAAGRLLDGREWNESPRRVWPDE